MIVTGFICPVFRMVCLGFTLQGLGFVAGPPTRLFASYYQSRANINKRCDRSAFGYRRNLCDRSHRTQRDDIASPRKAKGLNSSEVLNTCKPGCVMFESYRPTNVSSYDSNEVVVSLGMRCRCRLRRLFDPNL